jgi:hypothetical protein
VALSLFFDPLYKEYKEYKDIRSVAYDIDRLLNFYVKVFLYIIKNLSI